MEMMVFIKEFSYYNTGKSKKGWSSSILLSRTAGATYVRGTDFEGHNYFFSLGYAPNEEHNFQFILQELLSGHQSAY